MPTHLGTKTLASTNSYVSLLDVEIPQHVKQVNIQLKENDVNAIKYKIDGTLDGTNYEPIKAETVLAKNASIAIAKEDTDMGRLGCPWYKIRVQHKASVADTQGNTTATMFGD